MLPRREAIRKKGREGKVKSPTFWQLPFFWHLSLAFSLPLSYKRTERTKRVSFLGGHTNPLFGFFPFFFLFLFLLFCLLTLIFFFLSNITLDFARNQQTILYFFNVFILVGVWFVYIFIILPHLVYWVYVISKGICFWLLCFYFWFFFFFVVGVLFKCLFWS